jgi:hypothetical protein
MNSRESNNIAVLMPFPSPTTIYTKHVDGRERPLPKYCPPILQRRQLEEKKKKEKKLYCIAMQQPTWYFEREIEKKNENMLSVPS